MQKMWATRFIGYKDDNSRFQTFHREKLYAEMEVAKVPALSDDIFLTYILSEEEWETIQEFVNPKLPNEEEGAICDECNSKVGPSGCCATRRYYNQIREKIQAFKQLQ